MLRIADPLVMMVTPPGSLDLFLRRTRDCLHESRGGHKDDQRTGAHLLGGQAERAELVQPGGEKGELEYQGDIRTPSST